VANFLGRVADLFDCAVDLRIMGLTSGPFFLRDTRRRARELHALFHAFVGTIFCASRFQPRLVEVTEDGASSSPLLDLPAELFCPIAQFAGVPLRGSEWAQFAAEARRLGLL